MIQVIIDVNVDMSKGNKGYPEYLFDGIAKGQVTAVYGGTKYNQEIARKEKMLSLLQELWRSGRARKIDDGAVDVAAERLLSQILIKFANKCPKECDDHHLFALANVSGCSNVVSGDNRMAKCRDRIRNKVGHALCPKLRVIKDKSAYDGCCA